jgi:molybdopterin-guanine dinucleotide biosynthesis protein A
MRSGAIVLAGGHSSRMGRPKAELPIDGTTLLARTCTVLLEVAERVVVVARDAAQPLPPLPAGVARTHDAAPGGGPLVGIAAGLAWLAGEAGFGARDAAFVIACDHPFLAAAPLRALAGWLGDHDLVVPAPGGEPQPLCAVYRLAVRPAIDALLRTGNASPRALATAVATVTLDDAALRTIDPTLAFLRDVDTPADWADATRNRPG